MAAVTLIEAPESPELKEFYDRIEGASQGMGVLNVFKTMAHSPDLMQSWWGMMAVLFARLKLDPRLRELAILRLFQIRHCDYGYAHHVRIGKQNEITDEQLAAMDSYANSDVFSDLDKQVLEYTGAVTKLEERSKKLAAGLREHLSEQEVVELTFCIANWNLMVHLLLPLEIELEEPVKEFLPPGW